MRHPFSAPMLVSACILSVLAALPQVGLVAAQSTQPAPARTQALVNGRWFDGKGFRQRTFYSVNGFLTEGKPKKIDEEIDLGGKWVVPPFGEAHNHNLGELRGLDAQIAMYFRDGVFYSKNLHYVRERTVPVLGKVNNPSSIDVAYAHGGLVASGGHAVELYERVLRHGGFPGWKQEDLDMRAFFIIDTEADLERKWNQILAGKPDFIKTYLEYSEEYEQRRDDPKYYGQKGLNPKLLSVIVRKARHAGLRVSVHIETAVDFHHALVAGVDEIAHLPGYRMLDSVPISAYQISEEDARLAARKGVTVVTTTVLSLAFHKDDPQRLRTVRDNQIRNLKLLHKHGVKTALGSDSLRATSLAEAMNLYDFKVFDNLTLLKMWCETTPAAIFPNRKLGRFKEGYEASFLLLEGNPIEDFSNVKKIALRFKQGHVIAPSPAPEK